MNSNRRLRTIALALAVALFALLVGTIVSIAARPALAGFVVLGLVAVAAIGVVTARTVRRRIPRGTILEIDLDSGLVEEPPTDPLGRVTARDAVVLRDVVDALDRAAGDDRVTGVVVRLGNGGIAMAQAQELRDAIARTKHAGTRTVAFAESFGEAGMATVDYYLAASFEQIHLQPGGGLAVTGLVARSPFLRRLLDRVGAVPDLSHREEYKAAMYLFTEDGFVEPHEEETRAILQDRMDQIVTGIAVDRGLSEDRVRELVDRAPILAADALNAGLVDRLSYRDEALQAAGWDGEHALSVSRYLARAGRPHRKGRRIALVYGTGTINRGSSRYDLLGGGRSLGADDVGRAIREAADDDKVEAIVFRVDSRGGSAVGSEVVRREVVRAREKGTPVVVSMGDVAGSGGYWISLSADRIVAQPGTLTGSIGVVSGKLAVRDTWRRVGVEWDDVHLGANARYHLSDDPYSDSERERLEAGLDSIYDDFKGLVTEGRSLTPARVDELAKGRVWTGARARDLGLVDELGGLDRARELARELAGIRPDESLHLVRFPRRQPSLPFGDRGADPLRALLAGVRDALQALVRGPGSSGGEVRMPRPW